MSATNSLYLKHRLATSPAARPLAALRGLAQRLGPRPHPELALVEAEDDIIARKLETVVTPGMTCLDIGAHVGSVAQLLERRAGRGRVHLIEAVPDKAAWLKKRFGEANVHAVAVSETDGEVTFHVDDARPGFSALTAREGGQPRQITVPARRLDTLFPDTDFGFIKIDVEGHELPALRSGTGLIGRSRPVILFEAGGTHERTEPQTLALFDWLTTQMGYVVHASFELFHRDTPLTRELFQLYRTYPFLAFNYFAMPQPADGAE